MANVCRPPAGRRGRGTKEDQGTMSKRNKKRGKADAVSAKGPASPAAVTTPPVTQPTAAAPPTPAPARAPSATRRWLILGFVAALLVAGGLYAAYTAGVWPFNSSRDEVLHESWQAAYLGDVKIGHGHS